ncbi:hypothetical protein [Actinoplanes xinjiangensis]|uniref:hypothetical protein n=1 Tax=Actinoplanes xinjiangensis TaxID=512350 RepID=UPI00341533AF
MVNDAIAYALAEDCDDEEIFRIIEEDLGLGGVPAVTFDARFAPPQARFYPEGLSKTENARYLRSSSVAITADDIFEVFDRLHEQYLCTPDVQSKVGRLWHDATKGYASEDAEDQVQIVVRNGLTGAFPTCIIRAEQVQSTGRLDVEIEEPMAGKRSTIIRHAVIELKVLRGLRSTGTKVADSYNRNWIDKGVRQASEYRNERGARLAALCCFDMRSQPTGQTCFGHVLKLAADHNVYLRSWHLFSSSEAYRKFLTKGEDDNT